MIINGILENEGEPAVVDGANQRPYYLRLSVTEACKYRCPYCQPTAPSSCTPNSRLLKPHQIGELIGLMGASGVTKVRLTGGEPLQRPDILEIVDEISRVPEIQEIALTTNGGELANYAGALKRAGLGRVNVHIDSLKPERYTELSGGFELAPALAGVRAALKAGLGPVKLNVVLIKGVNDDELIDFCEFAISEGVIVRFIELMHTGPSQPYVDQHFMTAESARQKIMEHYQLTPQFEDRGRNPARQYDLNGGQGVIGFISSESEPFCDGCNRLRITADGTLLHCLYEAVGISLLPVLFDSNVGQKERIDFIEHAIGRKRSHHPVLGQAGKRLFSMASIGG
ncbi:MAG: GTP 3',8-cyclase MoaA [Rhodospirillaceae bacterium]|nr:GTP 3',8-cyclase MoaA [Rhodospirillaceae bacterium]